MASPVPKTSKKESVFIEKKMFFYSEKKKVSRLRFGFELGQKIERNIGYSQQRVSGWKKCLFLPDFGVPRGGEILTLKFC